MKTLRTTLIVGLAFLVAMEFTVWVWCRRNLVFTAAMFINITNEMGEVYFAPGGPLPESVTLSHLWGNVRSPERQRMKLETAHVIAGATTDFDRARLLCNWTRASCSNVSSDLEAEPSGWRILQGLRAGKGALCGPLARLLREALVANGIPARVVIMLRQPPFRSDGHAAVEAFVGRRWVMFDPTFNIYWTVNGVPANAWELRRAFYFRGDPQISFVQGAYTPDPTIATYYLKYPVCLNTIVFEYYGRDFAERHGLYRYPYLKLLQNNFTQLVRYQEGELEASPFRLHRMLAWWIYVWLPTLILLDLIAIRVAVSRDSRSSRGESRTSAA